jgi:hypothetical protein
MDRVEVLIQPALLALKETEIWMTPLKASLGMTKFGNKEV